MMRKTSVSKKKVTAITTKKLASSKKDKIDNDSNYKNYIDYCSLVNHRIELNTAMKDLTILILSTVFVLYLFGSRFTIDPFLANIYRLDCMFFLVSIGIITFSFFSGCISNKIAFNDVAVSSA